MSCLTCTSIPDSGRGWRGATLPPLLSLLTCRHEPPTGGGHMKTISVSSYRAEQEVDVSAMRVSLTQTRWRKWITSCVNSCMQHNTPTLPQGAFPGRKRILTFNYWEKMMRKYTWKEKCSYWDAALSLLFTRNSRKISMITGGWLRYFMMRLLHLLSSVSSTCLAPSSMQVGMRNKSLSPLCRTKWVTSVTKCFPSYDSAVWCSVWRQRLRSAFKKPREAWG